MSLNERSVLEISAELAEAVSVAETVPPAHVYEHGTCKVSSIVLCIHHDILNISSTPLCSFSLDSLSSFSSYFVFPCVVIVDGEFVVDLQSAAVQEDLPNVDAVSTAYKMQFDALDRVLGASEASSATERAEAFSDLSEMQRLIGLLVDQLPFSAHARFWKLLIRISILQSRQGPVAETATPEIGSILEKSYFLGSKLIGIVFRSRQRMIVSSDCVELRLKVSVLLLELFLSCCLICNRRLAVWIV